MPKKILLIENDDDVRELMRTTLEQNGYEVATASDGVSGYDMALFMRPDVIVTDIRLPGADGIHVVRRVRAVCLSRCGDYCVVVNRKRLRRAIPYFLLVTY